MRLDKYLKVSRLIKRRTVAKEITVLERVEINGRIAKPSSSVKINDQITLHLGLKIIIVEVTSLVPLKDELMYSLVSESKVSKSSENIT